MKGTFHSFSTTSRLWRGGNRGYTLVAFVVFFGLMGSLRAQTITVGDSTGWNAWKTGTNYMADPGGDQQTGQGTDDFIGNATVAAFQQKSGALASDPTNQYMLIRARMGKYTSGGFGSGNGANLSYGIDLTGDGALDLIVDMNSKGSVNEVSFASPGAGLNDGPSTTSWGNFFGTITLSSNTYDYRQTTDSIVLNSNGTSAPGTENGSTGTSYTANSWVTFALSYAQLQTAIRAYAVDPTGAVNLSTFVFNDWTPLSFIAFTSTQGNAINQDLMGTEGNMNSSLTYAQLGVITNSVHPGGVIPEPASFFQLGGLLGAGLIGRAWRRRRAVSPMESMPR